LRAAAFFFTPPVLRAVVFLRAELVLRTAVFFAVDLRAELFLLALVLGAELFLRLLPDLPREDPERELALELLPDEREPDRDEDRVVAGTARAVSAVSLDDSLNEPTVDG
jgi:hypothetical protein